MHFGNYRSFIWQVLLITPHFRWKVGGKAVFGLDIIVQAVVESLY